MKGKLQTPGSAIIDIQGLNKEDRIRIRQIGVDAWLKEIDERKSIKPNKNKGENKEVSTTTVTTPVVATQQQNLTVPILPTAAPVGRKRNILENSVLLSITRKWPSLSKTIDTSHLPDNADKGRLHMSKDLLRAQELKALFSYDSQLDKYLDSTTVPFPLKKGIYLLPLDLFNEVENRLSEYLLQRGPLIDACYEAYDQAVLEAQQALGPYFNSGDYKGKEHFKESFRFEWNYLEFNVASKLQEIAPEIAARESEKVTAKWTEASEAVQKLLRANMQDLVAHLVDRLSPGTDGKNRIFRDSTLTNINDFFRTFPARNLSDDAELAVLVAQAKGLTNGLDPNLIRTDETVRMSLLSGFSQIKDQLDTMIQVEPVRSIVLED